MADTLMIDTPLPIARLDGINETMSSIDDQLHENLNTPVAGNYDVIVAGAGPAGVSAAVAAGRHGARVLLIESNGCLGGVWTAGLLTWVFHIETSNLGGDIIERLGKRNAYVFANGSSMTNFTYDVESMKLVLDEMVLEAGVDVLLHTRVVAASVNADRDLEAVVTENKSGRQAWRAKVFIDATGDGDLGALAGNAFAMGAEEDGATQPMTHMGMIGVPDLDAVKDHVAFFGGNFDHKPTQARFKETLYRFGIETSYGHPTLFQVRDNLLALMINHEYGVDATNARQVTQASMRARSEMNKVVDGLNVAGSPFAGSFLVASAEHIGVREGRRLAGHYQVTIDDLMTGRRHEDAICRVCFNVDVHSTNPKKGKGLKTQDVVPYDIPLRALIARDVNGLMMAGRCISGDWLAFASYRITGGAVTMGEAAGMAAALSAKQGCHPHELAWIELAEKLPPLPVY